MKHFSTILKFFLYLSFSQAHPAWGIAIDKDRNIFFADIMHNGRGTVWKLTSEGELVKIFGDFHAHNVSIDAEGNLITAHGEDHHTLLRVSKDGAIDTLFHTLDFHEFFGGNCSYTPRGEIIFGIDKYIWRINAQGKKVKVGDYAIEWNQSVFGDEEGNYYGPNIGTGKSQLIKIDANGKASILAENLIAKHPFDPHSEVLLGMSKGPDGHLYIAEVAGQRIIKVLDNQQTETYYKADGDWVPTGLCFFEGEAYILEFKSKGRDEGPRITKMDEAGKDTVIFNYDTYQAPMPEGIGSRKEIEFNTWWLYILGGMAVLGLLYLFGRRNKSE
ncbi:MAG: hypothetical protein R3A50_13850 [Saprospiraceae bacterium]